MYGYIEQGLCAPSDVVLYLVSYAAVCDSKIYVNWDISQFKPSVSRFSSMAGSYFRPFEERFASPEAHFNLAPKGNRLVKWP